LKGLYLWLSFLLCSCAGAGPLPESPATQVVAVPNHFDDEPECTVKLPETRAICSAKGCSMPVPKGSSLRSIELHFDCLPKRSPTGFDNPPDYVKVQPLRARNSVGLLSLIDDTEGEPEEQLRDLGFCLYGEQTNFCGYAKVLRLKDGEKADATAAVKAFIEGIELRDQSKSKISK